MSCSGLHAVLLIWRFPHRSWDTDNCTGSCLNAFQPVLVFRFVSSTPGPVPLIAVTAMQGQITNPPRDSQCITSLESIVSNMQALSIGSRASIGEAH